MLSLYFSTEFIPLTLVQLTLRKERRNKCRYRPDHLLSSFRYHRVGRYLLVDQIQTRSNINQNKVNSVVKWLSTCVCVSMNAQSRHFTHKASIDWSLKKGSQQSVKKNIKHNSILAGSLKNDFNSIVKIIKQKQQQQHIHPFKL